MPFNPEAHPELNAAIEKAFRIHEVDVEKIAWQRRILIVGTHGEVDELRKLYGTMHEGRFVSYSASIYHFLIDFFAPGNITDQRTWSIPEKIITTGYMRSREWFAETVLVRDKLREIAERFGILIEMTPSPKYK